MMIAKPLKSAPREGERSDFATLEKGFATGDARDP